MNANLSNRIAPISLELKTATTRLSAALDVLIFHLPSNLGDADQATAQTKPPREYANTYALQIEVAAAELEVLARRLQMRR